MYYYFKDKKTDVVILRVPDRYIVYEILKYFVIDSTIDLRKTKLPRKERKKFFELLTRVSMIVDSNVICNDFPFLIKYLALCQFYEFPLMGITIKCRRNGKVIDVVV